MEGVDSSIAPPGDRCCGATAVACWGTVCTRSTNSQALANSWLERHQANSSVGVLHDLKGPGVKIVGEPASLVYPLKEIAGISAWRTVFLVFLTITQRRLEYLNAVPENHDSSPPCQSQPPGADDLIDTKFRDESRIARR
jgi:hypothetical protein